MQINKIVIDQTTAIKNHYMQELTTCCSVRAPILSWQLASRRHGRLVRFGSVSASCRTSLVNIIS